MLSSQFSYKNKEGVTVSVLCKYYECDSFDHLDPVLCRQVRAVTYEPELKVCFIQHSGGGEWGHPGGTIEKGGETAMEALERELVEETNTRLIKAIPIG